MKLIFYLIIGVLIGVALILALGFAGVAPFTSASDTVKGWIGGFDASAVASNPAMVLTAAGTAASVGIPLISKLSSVKQQAQATAAKAQTEISSLTGNLTTSKTELENTSLNLSNAEAKIAGMQSTVTSAQDQVAKLQAEKNSLLTQLEALNNIQARATVLADGKAVTVTKVV